MDFFLEKVTLAATDTLVYKPFVCNNSFMC